MGVSDRLTWREFPEATAIVAAKLSSQNCPLVTEQSEARRLLQALPTCLLLSGSPYGFESCPFTKIAMADERNQNPPPMPMTPYCAGAPPRKNKESPIAKPNRPPRKSNQIITARRFFSIAFLLTDWILLLGRTPAYPGVLNLGFPERIIHMLADTSKDLPIRHGAYIHIGLFAMAF
jgi:hypothetical protein